MRELLLSLLLTLLLEGAVALAWGIRGRDWPLFALANVLTNPAVVVLHALIPGWAALLSLELLAVLAEELCYSRLGTGLRRPWLLAGAANLFSFSVGLLLNKLL